MSGIWWEFNKEFKNKFDAIQKKKLSSVKKWDIIIAVYEDVQDAVPTKLNFHDIEAEKINICFKDKYLIISELNEVQEIDMDEDQFISENNEKVYFEKIIGFPRTIKKVAFSAVQNMVYL